MFEALFLFNTFSQSENLRLRSLHLSSSSFSVTFCAAHRTHHNLHKCTSIRLIHDEETDAEHYVREIYIPSNNYRIVRTISIY